jgi:NAD(P)-dependent dehydrogenase (short-subunit alcohol dehydrogenase family)
MEHATGKVAIVTGGTGAIGSAIAAGIAGRPGWEVVLVSRDERKAKPAVQRIVQATGNPRVRHEIADVSRRAAVEALAARWAGPLHLLVNNAAATPTRREKTPEGIELQLATNVLGYFWMIQAFAETLHRSAPARVVNVASYWAGDLELNDLEFKRRRYDNNTAYRQSKQADRMLTVPFAERLKPLGVTVNACHPGDVPSTLSRNLGFHGHNTPEEGARTPVWLATDPAVEKITGKYFADCREAPCQFARDRAGFEALFATCLLY